MLYVCHTCKEGAEFHLAGLDGAGADSGGHGPHMDLQDCRELVQHHVLAEVLD